MGAITEDRIQKMPSSGGMGIKGNVTNKNGRLNAEAATAISIGERRPKYFFVRASPVDTVKAVAIDRIHHNNGGTSEFR